MEQRGRGRAGGGGSPGGRPGSAAPWAGPAAGDTPGAGPGEGIGDGVGDSDGGGEGVGSFSSDAEGGGELASAPSFGAAPTERHLRVGSVGAGRDGGTSQRGGAGGSAFDGFFGVISWWLCIAQAAFLTRHPFSRE